MFMSHLCYALLVFEYVGLVFLVGVRFQVTLSWMMTLVKMLGMKRMSLIRCRINGARFFHW